MPCFLRPNLTELEKQDQARALVRLEEAIGAGKVSVVVGIMGSVAFKGWDDNAGISDLCAYRKLMADGSPALRRALARAEVSAGRSVNYQAVNSGLHSHDGGRTWSKH